MTPSNPETLDIDMKDRGHPPSADGLLMIDFDNCLVPWGKTLMENRIIKPEDRNAINQLKRDGFRIGIFTSRMSETWCKAAGTSTTIQLAYVQTQLMRNGLQYDFVTAEKLPAEAYFDDKAWHVDNDLASVLAVWRLNR